jgi:hypothetical protein
MTAQPIEPAVALARDGHPDPCDQPSANHRHNCQECGASMLFNALECFGIVGRPTCPAPCGGTNWGVSVMAPA